MNVPIREGQLRVEGDDYFEFQSHCTFAKASLKEAKYPFQTENTLHSDYFSKVYHFGRICLCPSWLLLSLYDIKTLTYNV